MLDCSSPNNSDVANVVNLNVGSQFVQLAALGTKRPVGIEMAHDNPPAKMLPGAHRPGFANGSQR
jgi:hypothetical protein